MINDFSLLINMNLYLATNHNINRALFVYELQCYEFDQNHNYNFGVGTGSTKQI